MHPLNIPDVGNLPDHAHVPVVHNLGRLTAHIENAGFRARVSHDLAEAAGIYRSSGMPLSVLADPSVHPEASHPGATMAIILEFGGEPVGCSIQRLVPRRPGSMAAQMRLLEFWYGDMLKAPDGTRCEVEPDWLADIVDCQAVYSCGFHVHRDAQMVRGLTWALIRLAHARALFDWRWDFLFGRGTAPVAARYCFEVYGFQTCSSGVWLHGPGQPTENVPHFLLATERAAFIAQASHPHYGNPLKPIGLPPALRAAAAE